MVDYASTYHVVIESEDRTAKTLVETVRDHWVSWAGPSRTFALDLDWVQDPSTRCATSSAPLCPMPPAQHTGSTAWWHGLTERRAGAWKRLWERTVDSVMVAALGCCRSVPCQDPASKQGRFSPATIGVRGQPTTARRHLRSSTTATTHYTTGCNGRTGQAARVAFTRVQTDQASQRVRRSRVKKTHYEPGDLVFIYRHKLAEKDKTPVAIWIETCTSTGNDAAVSCAPPNTSGQQRRKRSLRCCG